MRAPLPWRNYRRYSIYTMRSIEPSQWRKELVSSLYSVQQRYGNGRYSESEIGPRRICFGFFSLFRFCCMHVIILGCVTSLGSSFRNDYNAAAFWSIRFPKEHRLFLSLDNITEFTLTKERQRLRPNKLQSYTLGFLFTKT